MLDISSFQKSYGTQSILEIDYLHLSSGIYWVKGENGSGKSTFLKAAAGIIDFDGDIVLNKNIGIKKNPITYRKRVNFAEAEPLFPVFLTGKEMLKLFVSAKDAPANQEDYFLESMKMTAYINEPIGTYSSGMMKKLSLVLAFLGEPYLILLDEPLITIDKDSLIILYSWIQKKNDDGVSFLISSHQPLMIDNRIQVQTLLVKNQTITDRF